MDLRFRNDQRKRWERQGLYWIFMVKLLHQLH